MGLSRLDDDAPAEHKVSDLGRYRLIAELARGGMGIVYLALVRGPGGFNKLFVVKVLKDHLAEDRSLVAMFLEEARLAAKLSHPNVVQTIEVGTEGRRHYLAMEYLDGQPFHRVLSRSRHDGPPMPLGQQLLVVSHMLEGLHYAHNAVDLDGSPLRLVHRDVSPHNVFVTYDGQIKVLDFGIAKAVGSTGDTRSGVLKGKVPFMAPEQGTGVPVDARSDVFAAGVVLWDVVVGHRMWDRKLNDMQILHALTRGNIPRPRDHAPDVDPALEHIVLKATAFAPDDRYASAAAMQEDIATFLTGLGAQPGARDVGRFVGEAFAKERADVQATVDGQLKLMRSTSTGDFPALDLPRLQQRPGALTPSGMLLSGERDLDHEPEPSASREVSRPEQIRQTIPAVPHPRRRAPLALLVGAAAVALGGATAAWLHFAGAPASTIAAPSGAASPAAAPPEWPSASAAASESAAPAPAAPAAASPSVTPGPVTSAAPTAPAPTTPRRGSGPRAAVPASPPGSVAPPPAAPPPAANPAAPVRQQIDTSNPYGR